MNLTLADICDYQLGTIHALNDFNELRLAYWKDKKLPACLSRIVLTTTDTIMQHMTYGTRSFKPSFAGEVGQLLRLYKVSDSIYICSTGDVIYRFPNNTYTTISTICQHEYVGLTTVIDAVAYNQLQLARLKLHKSEATIDLIAPCYYDISVIMGFGENESFTTNDAIIEFLTSDGVDPDDLLGPDMYARGYSDTCDFISWSI